jgi:hypothetical protein
LLELETSASALKCGDNFGDVVGDKAKPSVAVIFLDD